MVIAVRDGDELPGFEELIPIESRRPRMTAGEALEQLPRPEWDQRNVGVWRSSSPTVAKRIAAIPVNGTRFDLPVELQLDCHKKMVAKSGSPLAKCGEQLWKGPRGRCCSDDDDPLHHPPLADRSCIRLRTED